MTSLLLGDLNDYITPAVACTKPSTTFKSDQPTVPKDASPVVINLNDCLACSGCITSAEAVLITEQTHQQLYAVLEENETRPLCDRKKVVVSICASSRTALCQEFGLSPLQVWRRLLYFFKDILKVDIVVDTAFAYNLALKEAAEEFVQRFRDNNPHPHPHPSTNEQKESTMIAKMGTGMDTDETAIKMTNLVSSMKPMLSSECPGWICYAEKKQAGMLDQICTVRSPQQILGVIVKSYLCEVMSSKNNKELIINRDNVFHVSVQACYDKKLEASRSEFMDAEAGIRDVDCVIATTEILAMIKEKIPEGAFTSLPEKDLDDLGDDDYSNIFRTWYQNKAGEWRLQRYAGSSAGGYLFYILWYAAKELFGITLQQDLTCDPHIKIEQHRNIDYTEYTLQGQNGDVLLRFAAVYGFRNIQTFVQKAKVRRINYHFVELMACPGACLFGGGQPKIEPGKKAHELHRSVMEDLFIKDADLWGATDQDNVNKVWEWIKAVPGRKESTLHTSYKSVEGFEKKNPLVNVLW